MVQCDRCGRDTDLPFRCNYCGGYFCSSHRLPEFHDCSGFYRDQTGEVTRREYLDGARDYSHRAPRYGSSLQDLFKFSDQEMRHLGVSLLIIAALPLTMLGGLILERPFLAIGAMLIFAAAFLLHELAHKFTAQRLGYWAEFRLNQLGLLITLFSFFSPFKLVAPGAVIIVGLMHIDDYGLVSIAGPVVNIAQAVIFLVLSFFSPDLLVTYLLLLGILINSSLALFNLLPFGVFDGAKILRWDWRAWLAATGVAAVLFIYVHF